MTPCHPSKPLLDCALCARHNPRLPQLAECRPQTIVINATVVTRDGRCPLFEGREIARPFAELTELEPA